MCSYPIFSELLDLFGVMLPESFALHYHQPDPCYLRRGDHVLILPQQTYGCLGESYEEVEDVYFQ